MTVSDIIELAKYKTIKEHNNKKNSLIIEIINEFCISNKIIHKYIPTVKFIFNLYSIQPFKDANNLTNMLFNKLNNKYIILHTKIQNKELIISIDNVKFIYIKLLFIPNNIVYKLLDIKNLELPLIVNLLLEYDDKKLLSEILDNNYDNNLINEFKKKNKIKKIEIQHNNIKSNIIKSLLNFIIKENIILLDYYAIQLFINEEIINFNNIIHLLYQDKNLLNIIQNYLNIILNNLKLKGEIIIKHDYLYIINNFRLKKTIIYYNFYNEKYKNYSKLIIVNCYNLLSYNVIPVINNIPHPTIILKFLIINLIYITMYSKNKNLYHQNINLIHQTSQLDKIFNNKYKIIGIYKNEELNLDIHQVYRPIQYKLNNGELRYI